MKISTVEALFAELSMNQFEFESVKGLHKARNIGLIKECLAECKIVMLPKGKYYRARKIEENSDGIFYRNGVPLNGFSSERSGVAPAVKCGAGRANDFYEQVLYVAEDLKTARMEVRPPKDSYVSVAYCDICNSIDVFDFSPYSEIELENYFKEYKDEMEDDCVSRIMMYIRIQRILTLPEYSENEYIISRDLVRLIKMSYPRVSGMVYISHFTGKKNVALWDDNKYIKFSDGELTLN